MNRLCNWAERLLPADVACAAGPVADHDAALFEVERAAVAKAAPKRRHEFSSGRFYARAALGALGAPHCPIAVAADRRPLWPDGYVGSISHSGQWCVAIAGRGDRYVGIGIDIERVDAAAAAVRDDICRPDEEHGAVAVDGEPVDAANVIFVIKEAVYKAYYPSVLRFLDFHDLRVTLPAAPGTFAVELVGSGVPSLAGRRRFTGGFGRVDDYVVAAMAAENSP